MSKTNEYFLKQEEHEEVAKAIATEDFKIVDLAHNHHMTLLKLGGLFQKKMNIAQVQSVLGILNQHLLSEPLPQAEIVSIVKSLEKYIGDKEAEIRMGILDYLTETDTATKAEIESAVFGHRTNSENKKRLDRILYNLITEQKIVKYSSWNYKILKEMEMSDKISDVGIPIVNFKMPYFHDYANFNYGDIIIVGGSTKIGKTTLAMNIVKRLVMQGIRPVYFYSESGGRFAKTAIGMGMKSGDFDFARVTDPKEIVLESNRVYVYDWIRPVDFSKTADIFDALVQKLDDSNSIMIGFVQLRDDNEWFAKDLIRQFVSLSAKYTHCDTNGITQLALGDVRDRKSSSRKYVIPCQFIEETREVKTLEEIEEQTKIEKGERK